MRRTTALAIGILLTLATTMSAVADLGDPLLKIVPADAADDAAFGTSVAAEAGVLVAGSPGEAQGGTATGAVRVHDPVTGDLLHVIVPADGAAGDAFGQSVDVSTTVIAVGAPGHDALGAGSGAVYLFEATDGSLIHKILPADGTSGDAFGSSVAIADGILVVGAKYADAGGIDSGAAYVFDVATGLELHKLLPSDASGGDTFGGSIAIDAGVVAVGAHAKWNGPMFLAGAAYLFDASTGSELQKLLPNDAATNDFFGSSIAIDGDRVIVGAWAKSIVFDHSGAAYLFDAATGVQIGPRLVPADSQDRDHFGRSVAIRGPIAAIGAPGDSDAGFEAGSVYLYDVDGAVELVEVIGIDASPIGRLGEAVALGGGQLVAGSPRDDAGGPSVGSVHVYEIDPQPALCLPDLDHSGSVDFDDLLALLIAWGEAKPDLDGDGIVGFGDLLALLSAWGPCSS